MAGHIIELVSYGQQWLILLDILVAMVLGGIIGLERELKQKPAGLRTNMVIAGAAAVFVGVGWIGALFYGDMLDEGIVRTDPIRILNAVIVGVGFIGAGTILHSVDRKDIQHLTSAATVWMSAAVGMTVALKLYFLAIGITVALLVINTIFDGVEKWILRRWERREKK